MNIYEAAKSGHRFRRPVFPDTLWYFYREDDTLLHRTDGAIYYIDRDDIMADDWILEDKKKSLL